MTPESKILIQGITEPRGLYYATKMKAYGTNVVAGIGVGQGGENVNGIPVFDLVEEAIKEIGEVEASVIFVNPYQVLDAALEAIAVGIKQLIIASEDVPPLDLVKLLRKVQATNTLILGPGSTGIILPGKMYAGTYEPQFYQSGNVGIISFSDGLSYETALALNKGGLGQSIVISLGTDDIIGSHFEQWLSILEENTATEAIVLIGYPHGKTEEMAAEYIKNYIKKPVVVYIPGENTPVEVNFKDAATIIATQLSSPVAETVTFDQKILAFQNANIPIAQSPAEIPNLIKGLFINY
jgi:succinyl-CoA synthetase alpha subunit